MTREEELMALREEKKCLQEQLAQRDERIEQLEAVLEQQNSLLEQMQEQISRLSPQLTSEHVRQSKDSHNSHLPPSSDRFVRQPKSLHHKSEKKTGGQPGHLGSTLHWSSTPDEVSRQQVERCEACQSDLRAVACCGGERRQVVDVPPARVIVREYQAEHKQCPQCQHITVACFPKEAPAPLQYGPGIGAIGVYLTQQQLLPLARGCRGDERPAGSPHE